VVLVEDVDEHPLRVQQPGALGRDPVEHLFGVTDGVDLRGDLAQRALHRGLARELRAGAVELLDEAGVGDGHRCLVRQDHQQLRFLATVGVPAVGVDGQRAQDIRLRRDGHRDGGADVVLVGERVWLRRVREAGIPEVVPGPHGPPDHDRPTRDAFAGLGLALALDGPKAGVMPGGGVIRPVQPSVPLVEEVDASAVRLEQARGRVHGALEDLLLVVQDRERCRDLAQLPLDADPPRQLPTGCGELVHELRGTDGTRHVVREGPGEERVAGPERGRTVGEDAHGTHGGAAVRERRHDERLGPGLAHEHVGLGVMDEPGVGQVIPGTGDRELAHRDAHETGAGRQADPLQGASTHRDVEAAGHRHGQGCAVARQDVHEPAITAEERDRLLERGAELSARVRRPDGARAVAAGPWRPTRAAGPCRPTRSGAT
jgi:hypothetical protein